MQLPSSGMTVSRCAGSAPAPTVLIAALPCDAVLCAAATSFLVAFLLDPAATLGRHPPGRMKLQCLRLVAALLLGLPCVAPFSQPAPYCRFVGEPSPSCLVFLDDQTTAAPNVARLSFPHKSLPALDCVWRLSAPKRGVAVADARLGLALRPVPDLLFGAARAMRPRHRSHARSLGSCCRAPPGLRLLAVALVQVCCRLAHACEPSC